MATSKIFTGARAKVFVDNVLVAIYDNCSYQVQVGVQPAFLLGRYSAAEITQTSYEVVSVNCSGFRIIGNGGHVLPKFPKLQDLLNLQYITLTMTDRQAGASAKPILTVENCVPVSYGTGASAKSNSRINISYLGTVASDEDGNNTESAGAVNLPA